MDPFAPLKPKSLTEALAAGRSLPSLAPNAMTQALVTPTGDVLGSGVDTDVMLRSLAGAKLPPSLLTSLGVSDEFNDKLAKTNIANFGPGLVRSVWSGLTAPGDALAGKYDPTTDLSRIGDMAGLMTFGAGAVPAEAGGLRAGMKLYQGTREPSLALTNERALYLTPTESEAMGYAHGRHLGGSGTGAPRALPFDAAEGKTLDINDRIMDAMDMGDDIGDAIGEAISHARAQGYRYIQYDHPSFSSGEDQRVVVSLYPKDDLTPSALPMDDAARMARADAMGFRRDMPLAAETVPADEALQAPAVQIEGRIFSGKSHGDAVAAAERAGIPEDRLLDVLVADPMSDGFVTNAGRFVPRAAASEIAQRRGLGDFGAMRGLTSDVALPDVGAAAAVARIGATPPGLPGGQGIWSRPLPARSATGEVLWHRAERPGSFDAAGLRDEDVQATLENAFGAGHDAVKIKNYTRPGGQNPEEIIVVRDPAQLRSPAAAFNPRRRDSRDILAGIAGLTAGGTLAAVGANQIAQQPGT